jgi:hypothetical protein
MIDRQVKRLCYLKSLASVERLGSSQRSIPRMRSPNSTIVEGTSDKYNHRTQFRETECENL